MPIYRVFLLSFPHERRLYRTEILYPPGHPVTATVLRDMITKTPVYCWDSVEYVREMRKCITDNCGQNHEGGAQLGG